MSALPPIAADAIQVVPIPPHPPCHDASLWPLVLYRQVLPLAEAHPPEACEALFAGNGWHKIWHGRLYGTDHCHCRAHETLGICRGWARVRFGGEGGVILEVRAGDVVVVPAGVMHQRVEAAPDLQVVGCYPAGQEPDVGYGKPEEEAAARERARQTPLPASDPVTGGAEPLLRLWGGG